MSDLVTSIKQSNKAFIIAEIGVNYYDIAASLGLSLLDAACLMISKAASAGADAVKFQSYTAKDLACATSPAYWDLTKEPTTSQFELFSKFDLFKAAEYEALARYCDKVGIVFLSTPFHNKAVEYLAPLVPAFKVASSDITNHSLIKYIANFNKPIFLSTGASSTDEIEAALGIVRPFKEVQVCLMHCTLAYPTKYEDANLRMLLHLAALYPGMLLGISDHTLPDSSMLTLCTAYTLGAKVIEKHFTLDKALLGNDHYHSMDEADLKCLRFNLSLIDRILGSAIKQPVLCEAESRKYARRSAVSLIDIECGEALCIENVTFKRPGIGIAPSDFYKIDGLRLRHRVCADTILTWEDFVI